VGDITLEIPTWIDIEGIRGALKEGQFPNAANDDDGLVIAA
jgi:hypothetical protein